MANNQNMDIYIFLGAFVATVVATLIYVKFSGLRNRIENQYENNGKFERDSWLLDIARFLTVPVCMIFFPDSLLGSVAWGVFLGYGIPYHVYIESVLYHLKHDNINY